PPTRRAISTRSRWECPRTWSPRGWKVRRSSGSAARCSARARQGRRSAHRLDRGSQAALVARRRVLVDDLLVSDAVDHALRGLQRRRRGGLVAGLDGLANRLDRGAQARPQARVVQVALDGLAGALARRGNVGHERISLVSTP